MDEARLTDTETGRVVEGDGWFIANAGEMQWHHSDDGGTWCSFEAAGAAPRQYGIGFHVVMPGQPNALYHAETDQEDFLVVSGECIAIVEGQERRMRQWDILHCPAGTEHIIVGAGDGPCVLLMVGARSPGKTIRYPVSAAAARYGASVKEPADHPKDAYVDWTAPITTVRAPWPPDGGSGG